MLNLCPTYHIPVLLHETIDALQIQAAGRYADLTFGGGGHSREILNRLGREGHLFCFDQDADAQVNIPEGEERLTFVHSNFRFLKNWMRYYGVYEGKDGESGLDGIIADLGVSSHHFDDESRGFSFRFDAPLDMRMNGRGGHTAAHILNTATEERLATLFYLYGELKNSRRLAAAILKARQERPFDTTESLLTVLRPLMPREREKKDLARAFQALRIEVNQEMQALEQMLHAALDVLRPGGRLVILTYHSLEDRMVKNFMRAGRLNGEVEQDFYGRKITRIHPIKNKPILPSLEEQERNPRSRSAKLRMAQKL